MCRHSTSRGGSTAWPSTRVAASRWSTDIAILSALGRFFAGKLRAAVCYELHAETGSREALRCAVEAYRSARRAWQGASARAEGVYVADLTYGPQQRIRGHWSDRLLAIDADLRDMEDRWTAAAGGPADEDDVRRLLDGAARGLPDVQVDHVPPTTFRPDADLPLEVELRGPGSADVHRVTVRYRPMNQALPFATSDMAPAGGRFAATIPSAELDGRYPLAYAFVLRNEHGSAWRYPNLGVDLVAEPYIVVRSEHAQAFPAAGRAS